MDPDETSGNETFSGMRLVWNGTSLSSEPSFGHNQQCDNNHGPRSYGEFHTSDHEDTLMPEDFGLPPFQSFFSDEDLDSLFTSPIADNGSFPVSPFTCLTVSSTPEQGDDAGAQTSSMANKEASWHLTHPEGQFSMEAAASHGKSVVDVLPAEMSISGSVVDCNLTRPGCVRLASACNGRRSSSSEVAPNSDFKGVKKKKNTNKWPCEIRISTKFNQDKLKKKDKLWLGTYDTAVEAARALHVGRYLVSFKNKKAQTDTNFDPNTEKVLLKFRNRLLAQPLDDELLQTVKKYAHDYGC